MNNGSQKLKSFKNNMIRKVGKNNGQVMNFCIYVSKIAVIHIYVYPKLLQRTPRGLKRSIRNSVWNKKT
jgi:hypothetical protein